jgi:ABC-type sugar transport system ATPase subunit
MVFQNSSLDPHMSVRENVAFPLQSWRKDDLALLLELVGLG